mgnify:CR=1 FL=1
MSRFYIRELIARGPKVKDSRIAFTDGVNIIHGPSNTGKSYVIGCIDFILGGDEIPFTMGSTGYDTVAANLVSVDGETAYMERKIIDGKNGETGAGTVRVESPFDEISDGELSIKKKEYSDFLLRLMGITKRTQIISNQDYEMNDLTFRSIIHFFFIDENSILTKKTVLTSPKFNKINASLMALLFLMTGNNYSAIVPYESKEERERKAAQKTGVINYLNNKIKALKAKRDQLEADLAATPEVDIEEKIEGILREIELIDGQIIDANKKSRSLLARIYEISARLEEARLLRNRYKALRTQYTSDIRRLRFIVDGEKKQENAPRIIKCPFCEHDMEDTSQSRVSYIESASAELQRIKLQMEDLRGAETDIQLEIDGLEQQIRALNAENDSVTEIINRILRPRMAELRQTVESYKRILEARQELFAIARMATELDTDASLNKPDEGEGQDKFSARDMFTSEDWKKLSDQFSEMVKACAYPGFLTARVELATCDAVVNGKYKKDEGKGYRAYLNTIMLFNLMKFLESYALYCPHLLVLDSPILSLKEKKKIVTEKEKATPGMRASLFTYMIQNCGENQLIIAENELPYNVDYSGVNLIEFSMDEAEGRYGFLLDVRNEPEEQEDE